MYPIVIISILEKCSTFTLLSFLNKYTSMKRSYTSEFRTFFSKEVYNHVIIFINHTITISYTFNINTYTYTYTVNKNKLHKSVKLYTKLLTKSRACITTEYFHYMCCAEFSIAAAAAPFTHPRSILFFSRCFS